MTKMDESKSICTACHKFYDSVTGERVKELEHITVAHVEEQERCKPCLAEMKEWDASS